MAINLFNTSSIMDRGQQAFEDTNANIQGMMSRYTNARAGRAYASGDRQGAARMLAQGGNLDGARVLQGDLRTEQRQGMQDTQAAEALTYERGRDQKADARLKTADDLQAQENAINAAKERFAVLEAVGLTVMKEPMGSRKPKLDRGLELFAQVGYPAQVIDQLRNMTEDQLDDNGILATIAAGKDELVKLAGGGLATYNNKTGTFKMLREPEKPPGNYIRGPDGEWMINPLAVKFKEQTRAPLRTPSASNSGLPAEYDLDN